uniref:Proteasome component Ecm29 N-terminal domain-containing protein n=1 Tax=Fagus sylvatica TaxID=28930 RepID=A0A2N9FXH9_FAGSY
MAESSATPLGNSDADREEMLDRMLTRLALCDDSKLQPLLSKLLPLTISSLSSQSLAVRKKWVMPNRVIVLLAGWRNWFGKCSSAVWNLAPLCLMWVLEILSHVNKRVKHHLEIGLPLLELWKMYSEANAAPMVRNFCIVYIEMAFERVQVKEKEELAPMLLVNISKLPLQHQEIILRIATKVIGECHSSRIDDEVAAKYRSINDSQDRELFIEFCLHTLLYQPPPQSGGCPPGLSIAQANRVSGKHLLKSDILLMRKLGILNVIEAMEFAPELVYPIYVAACVDWQEPVVKRGEELLKKKGSSANLENPNLINRLFILFNGTAGAENVDPDLRVNPGNPALKARLMSIFCHSVMAANSFPSTLQCIFGCIYGT